MQERTYPMSSAQNIEMQKKMGECVSTGNLEGLRDVFTPDTIDHDPAPTQGPGAQGYIDLFTQMRSAFPDLQVQVNHLVTDDNNVCFAYTMTGTHLGDFQGIPPTGKKVSARGMQISLFRNGKIAERWGSSDELGILKQLQS